MIKIALLPLLCSLLLAGLAHGESVLKKATQDKHVGNPMMTAEYIEARLKTIKIQDFDIQKAELGKAIAHLDSVVEQYGLQIMYRPVEGREEPVVNLKTRDLTLSRNLSFISAQGGYDWWVESGVIVIGLPESQEALITEIIPVHSSTVRRFVATESAK